MKKFSGNYECIYSSTFDKNLRKLKKKEKVAYHAIKKAIDKLRADPYHNTKLLHGDLKGKRNIYVGKGGLRILFAVCEECRKTGCQGLNGCADCHNYPPNTIFFFFFDKRSRMERIY